MEAVIRSIFFWIREGKILGPTRIYFQPVVTEELFMTVRGGRGGQGWYEAAAARLMWINGCDGKV
jgi:hypothetical protein